MVTLVSSVPFVVSKGTCTQPIQSVHHPPQYNFGSSTLTVPSPSMNGLMVTFRRTSPLGSITPFAVSKGTPPPIGGDATGAGTGACSASFSLLVSIRFVSCTCSLFSWSSFVPPLSLPFLFPLFSFLFFAKDSRKCSQPAVSLPSRSLTHLLYIFWRFGEWVAGGICCGPSPIVIISCGLPCPMPLRSWGGRPTRAPWQSWGSGARAGLEPALTPDRRLLYFAIGRLPSFTF